MLLLRKEKGQALVEFALMFTFLLVLIIGITEAGVLLNRQIVVVNAAREGARFGAYGAEPDAIHAQTLLATSQMFEFTEENAVVAIIHAVTDDAGVSFTEWITDVYPSDAAIPHVTRGEVLEQLQAEGDAADLRLVVVDVRYDNESMLGLPFVGALAGRVPIGSWTVMRLGPVPAGQQVCTAYPIAMHRSSLEGKKRGDRIVDVPNGMDEADFGWLRWPQDPSYASAQWLREFLGDPGSVRDFQNADDSGDTKLSVGDLVWANVGLSASDDNREALNSLLGGKYIRVIVWDTAAGTGVGAKYHVYGFAVVSIISYDLTGERNRISAKFVGWSECG